MLPLPSCPGPPVGGGLRPAPLGEVRFRVNFRYFGTPSPRVGADLCVRPWAGPAKDRGRADTSVGPYGSHCNLHQTQNNGRGQSPAPTGRSQCQAAGRCSRHRPLRPAGGREGGTPGSSCPTGGCGEPPRLPWPAAHSGAFAARSRGVGWNRSRDHPQKGPATPDNPSVTAKP